MALEDQIKNQEPVAPEEEQDPSQISVDQLSDEEEEDLKIMVNLGKNLIDDGGYEVIEAAEKSSDPGQVIGQFLMQMVSQMAEQLPADAKPSPRIFLCEGGWVEEISDYLQDEYDIPEDIMDRAEIYIGTAAQSIAQGQQAPGGPAAPAAQAAPAPAMPQQGGLI